MFFDVIVIGAGAAGLMCAAQAGARGRRVLLIDHVAKIGERIRISGGGRCNFTNRSIGADNYLSQNPHFCRSALSRFTQYDFIAMIEARGIAYHERDHGQLFCNDSAQDIIKMLKDACDAARVQWAYPCKVFTCQRRESTQEAQSGIRFALETERGSLTCHSLVIASGGLSIPPLGATPFGYQIAEQMGLPMVAPKAALVPLVLAPEVLESLKPLAGSTLNVRVGCDDAPTFRENVLLTHRGLSGPAILQISSYWQQQDYRPQDEKHGKKHPVEINLLPDLDIKAWLLEQRRSKVLLPNLLAEHLPKRFAQEWCALLGGNGSGGNGSGGNTSGWNGPLNECSNHDLEVIARSLQSWKITPSGTLGYAKAEVTLGGVDTHALSSKTMEAKAVPGLYFIGEVVDVTGWLGGYNFQWAWSSGWVAGQVV